MGPDAENGTNNVIVSPPQHTPEHTIGGKFQLLREKLFSSSSPTKVSLRVAAVIAFGSLLALLGLRYGPYHNVLSSSCICSPNRGTNKQAAQQSQRTSNNSPNNTCSPSTQCGSTTPSPQPGGNNPPTHNPIDDRIVTVLQNIRNNGYNYATTGPKGLFIDWQYPTTTTLSANGGKCTVTNTQGTCPAPAHDSAVDFRYLHNLMVYVSTHPSDSQNDPLFNAEIQKYFPIVFSQDWPGDIAYWGWAFTDLQDMYTATANATYKQTILTTMQDEANTLDGTFFHKNIGAFYTGSGTSATYNSDRAISEGSGLVQAGKYFNNQQWIIDGQTGIQFVFQHAYLSSYGLFLGDMTNLFNQDGTANPNETVFNGANADGGNAKAAPAGEEAWMLTRAYEVDTSQASLLTYAENLLSTLSPGNSLGLWDTTNLGYFYGVHFNGTTYQNPGSPTLINTRKESGRQLNILKALHTADHLLSNKYANLEQQVLNVALNHAYYAAGHGYLYSMTPTWQPRNSISNYTTTEAMGIAVEALLLATST